MILNRRLQANPKSPIRRIGEEAAMIPGCLRLTIGEPDFDAPLPVRKKIAEAILAGDTHYPPNAGIPELRAEVAAMLNARFGSRYVSEETLVSVGSTEAIAAALFAILNPGDEVICLTPCFGLYKPLIEMAGGVFVPLPRKAEKGFSKAILASLLTERTKAVLFSSPNNPDGWVADHGTLSLLAETAKARDLFLIEDGAYDSLVFEDGFSALPEWAEIHDRVIYISALSKTYAMTGVRLGYAAAEAEVMREMVKAHSFLVVSAPGFVQRGCLGVFSLSPETMRETYRRRRDLALSRLSTMGLPCETPGGGFYVYPDIREFRMPSEDFCSRLMREAKLALVPATAFSDEGHVRISCCYADGELSLGLSRLAGFISGLREKHA